MDNDGILVLGVINIFWVLDFVIRRRYDDIVNILFLIIDVIVIIFFLFSEEVF